MFSQIAGLGTLIGAAFPPGGQGAGDRLINFLKGLGTGGQPGSDQWLVDLIGTDTDTTTTGGSVVDESGLGSV